MISFWIELRYCCYGKTVHNGKAGAIFIPNIKTLAKNGFKQTLTEFSASDVTRSFTKGSWPKQGHSHLFGGTREQASFIFCRTVNQMLALMTCTVMKRRASWQWMTPFITWRTTLAVCNWLKLCVGEQTTTRRTITITAAACGSWTAASRTHRHAPTASTSMMVELVIEDGIVTLYPGQSFYYRPNSVIMCVKGGDPMLDQVNVDVYFRCDCSGCVDFVVRAHPSCCCCGYCLVRYTKKCAIC